MSVFEIRGRVTYRSLMRHSKSDLVHFYLSLLDACAPASADASAARNIINSHASPGSRIKLTVTQELGLLRRWYEGTKHLIGSDS